MIDYQTRLTQVTAAITALLSGGAQKYVIDGQEVTKLDLAWLSKEEARLSAKVARQTRRGGAFTRVVPR